MKLISTETQRRIMYIPFVNITNFFIAAYNCGKAANPISMKFKAMICVVCHLLPLSFLWSLLSAWFPQQEHLFFLCAIYTEPLVMSWVLIKFQHKYLLV